MEPEKMTDKLRKESICLKVSLKNKPKDAESFLLNGAHGSTVEGHAGRCQDELVSKRRPLGW